MRAAVKPRRDAWGGYFYGAVAASRPFVLVRGWLLLLAIEAWVLLLPHGSRYGAGGFNVAHFAVFDAVGPRPTAALYVGLTVLSGLLAFTAALTGERVLVALLAATYTYGWAMSLLDGFQHHYLSSLFLLCFALAPEVRAADVGGRVAAPSHRLLTVTLAIVYLFAAASKYEARWRAGGPLESMASRPPFDGVAAWFGAYGVSPSTFWGAASVLVTAMELVVGAAYLLSTRRRAQRSGGLRALAWSAVACALGIHLGATVLRLDIGLFSAYMLLAALAWFLPEAWVERVAHVVARPAIALGRIGGSAPAHVALAAALGVGACLLAGASLDLPGAAAGTGAFAGLVALGACVGLAKGPGRASVGRSVAAASAALACTAAVSLSSVRFDFYRYLGADLERERDLAGALDAFEKAERYAPPDHSRRAKIEELRRKLGRSP